MKAIKTEIIDYAALIAYKFILDIVFAVYVLPQYGYEVIYSNFHTAFSWQKVVVGYVLSCTCLWLFKLIPRNSDVSRFVIMIQLAVIVIPYFTVYESIDFPTWYLAVVLTGYASVALSVIILPRISIAAPSSATVTLFMGVIASIVAYVYVGLVLSGGLSRLNFNFSKVYEYRDEYQSSSLFGFGYLTSWVAYVFDMAALVIAIKPRGKFGIVSGLAIIAIFVAQILFFGMTNFKAYLFIPFIVIGMVLFAARWDCVRAVLLGAPIVMLFALLLSLLNIPFSIAMLQRTFFAPAALHSLYFQYFSEHSHLFMSGSVIGYLFDTADAPNSVYLVSQHYWGRIFSPNVGWIGNAFANFGILGVAGFGAILAFVLRIGDGFVRGGVPSGAAEGLLVGAALSLCSSGLFTAFLTHGMIASLIVLWLMKWYWAPRYGRTGGIRAQPLVRLNDVTGGSSDV